MQRFLAGEEVDGKTANVIDEWNGDTYEDAMDEIVREDGNGKEVNYGFRGSGKHHQSLIGRTQVDEELKR